ncbi:MAG: CBS domain-containing protein [Myxococcota bacterium]|jgi:predicted transcriptional regulator|nr:CBS domain-containing protein [Myxococcota bacterium]
MAIGDYIRREIASVDASVSIQTAASQMAEQSVGCLLVQENGRFAGIVTDRDVALRTIRGGLDPKSATIGSIIERDTIVIHEDRPVRVAVKLMSKHGLRRLLVGNKKGDILGLVTWDDLIGLIARELSEIAGTIAAQGPHLAIPASRAVIELAHEGESE